MYLPALEPSNNRGKSLAGITEEQSSKNKSLNKTANFNHEAEEEKKGSAKFQLARMLSKANSQLSINEHDEKDVFPAPAEVSPTKNATSSEKDNQTLSPGKRPQGRNNKAKVTFLFAEGSKIPDSPGKQSVMSPNGKSFKSMKSSLSGIIELDAPKPFNDAKSRHTISKKGSAKSIFFNNSLEIVENKHSLQNVPSGFKRNQRDKGADYTRIEFPNFGLILEDDPYKKEFQNKLDRLKQLTTASAAIVDWYNLPRMTVKATFNDTDGRSNPQSCGILSSDRVRSERYLRLPKRCLCRVWRC